MTKTELVVFAIILISFVIGFYFYSQMPDKIASHWNAQDQVDGYMPKFWGMFLMPVISIGLLLLFMLIPKIDPLKKNIEKFRKYYNWFVLLIIMFLFYIYLLTVLWNIGFRFAMSQMMLPSLGILFYYIGILLENAKRNWFIGIRTPWTLSSDKVWDKTHKIGSKLFKIIGVIVFLGIFFQKYSIWFILVPILLVAVYLIVYSYFEYQKLGK